MKVQLKKIEAEKLTQAIMKEQALKQEYIAKQQQLHEAVKARQDIFEMICDNNKLDMKKFDGKIQINGTELTLTELSSKDVRERIKRAAEQNREGAAAKAAKAAAAAKKKK